MARALQCPSCGTKTRLDGVASDTFQCEQCGQVLKVPPSARRPTGPSPARPATGNSPPPPARRPAPATPNEASDPLASAPPPAPSPDPKPPVVVAGGGTAVLPPRDTGAPPRPSGRAARGANAPRDALPLTVRIAAWVFAVPVGLAIVGVPARSLGYLTSQKLLDVFVKHTLARFVPLAVIVVLWALATTVLVELFVEGGRWLMLRRRTLRGPSASDLPSDPQPPAPPPPPRPRGSAVRARGS